LNILLDNFDFTTRIYASSATLFEKWIMLSSLQQRHSSRALKLLFLTNNSSSS